jgi:hypothetical protein
MMPGQEPYTEEEWSRVRSMIEDAAVATEMFTQDELEEYLRLQEARDDA